MTGDAPIPVFVGPSIPPEARPAGPFDWRPPAAAGDLLAVAEANEAPRRLCLIDGFFDHCPAPWHKEILLLLARGTTVFGAASMGALRAAELDRFGMMGVGAIYRAYRDGRLTGDDEVALIHAPERLGWAELSVPLVEIRATLCAAVRCGLINARRARAMRDVAAAIHFTDRDWPALRAAWLESQLVYDALAEEVEAGHVPLKQRDALACLAAALVPAEQPAALPMPPATCFIAALRAQSPPRPR